MSRNKDHVIRIATRASDLALAQTDIFIEKFTKHYPSVSCKVIKFTTKGDMITDRSLESIGGKGLFVKPLENALLTGDVDLAVHSFKDLPANMSEVNPYLTVPCVLERDSVSDVMVSSYEYKTLEELPKNASIGTASPRRAAQLVAIRKDFNVSLLRGNINTRLNKCSDFSAIVLAESGLRRLNLLHKVSSVIPHDQMLPAAAQGAIAVQCSKENKYVIEMLSKINHMPSYITTAAERTFLKEMQGDCSSAIAAMSKIQGNELFLRAEYFLDGRVIRAKKVISGTDYNVLGIGVAHLIKDQM